MTHAPWAEGPADFAIGLRPVSLERWLEGGEPAAEIVARKSALLAASPDAVWGERAGSQAGQAEALTLVEAAVGVAAPAGGADLWRAGLLVPDDLCQMQRIDGAWTLTAVSLCAGTYFTAADAIGRSLAGLHGPVPGFGDRLLGRVERLFDRLPDGSALERFNWTVTASGALHLPRSAPVRAGLAAIPLEAAGEQLFVRVERQTLRRLPATGGVLFTIRIWRQPLAELSGDRLASFERAWRSAAPDFRRYKGLAAYDAHLDAFFASQAKSSAAVL